MPYLLAIPACVVAWFLLVVALATAIRREEQQRGVDDHRMIRHLSKTYPLQDGNPEP